MLPHLLQNLILVKKPCFEYPKITFDCKFQNGNGLTEFRTGNSSKYTFVGSDADLACSIGFAENGKTYIQVESFFLS